MHKALMRAHELTASVIELQTDYKEQTVIKRSAPVKRCTFPFQKAIHTPYYLFHKTCEYSGMKPTAGRGRNCGF